MKLPVPKLAALAALLVVAAVLVGCSAGPPTTGAAGSVPIVITSDSSAAATLAQLPVKGRAPRSGYDRAQFGPAWADVDHNGCDTRNDILARDLQGETFKPGTQGCVVLTGTLHDPYTGTTVAFTRGQDTSEAVQIEHVVALSDAWQKGAQQLDATSRKNHANDPLNLLAVDGPTNHAKGDADAATWLPPRRAFRCAYVARQVAVKAKYHLWVTAAEKEAIQAVLTGCPGEALPTDPTLPASATQALPSVLNTGPDQAASEQPRWDQPEHRAVRERGR